jgi:hypothetical protein
MEEILTECTTQCVAQGWGDAYDFYHMWFLSRDNISDWRGLLDDADRCIQMQPEDPMSYYWKGVAVGHLYSATSDVSEQRHNDVSRKNAFCFIEIAPPEGRKVCQTWWNLAVGEMMQSKAYSDARGYKVGDSVTVKGLKTKPQHNGKSGTVFGHTSASEKYSFPEHDDSSCVHDNL